jgi:hypothetical protein
VGKIFSTGELARLIEQQQGCRCDAQHIRRCIKRGYLKPPQRIGWTTRVFTEADVPGVIKGLKAGDYWLEVLA